MNMQSQKYFIDCHSHSEHSPDSSAKIIDMCNKAQSMGIKVYAITDHCECNEFYDTTHNYFNHSLDSFLDIESVKSLYPNMKILTGVELAQPTEFLDYADIILKRDYDMVIGSIHNIPDMPDFYFLDYLKTSIEEVENLVQIYYEQMYKMALWNKFDTMAHLTYPLRYITGEHNIHINMKKFDDIIAEIFKTVIKNEKAIEINTSGLRQKINAPLPSMEFIRLYKDLGGKYLTIGADAHNPADVGKNILDGLHMAYECGFRQITYFEKRKPVLIEID